MTSVNKETIRTFLVDKVLPAVKEKWPTKERGRPIFIQQDNAKTHIAVDDPDFCHVAQEDGWDIRLMCQPPNSPDLNVLDLGFFAALQALFEKSSPSNIPEIEANVIKAYLEYPVDRSNRVFLNPYTTSMHEGDNARKRRVALCNSAFEEGSTRENWSTSSKAASR